MNKNKMSPHNVEAEEAVLGSLLIDPEVIPDIAAFLRPGDFYIQKNAWIYEAILALRRQGTPVDYVTLCDELERQDQLEKCGGVAYITHLINAVPSALNAESYAHIVEEAAVRRELIVAASEIVRDACQEDKDVETTLRQAEESVRSAGKRTNGKCKVSLLSADAILTTEWPEPIWAVPGLLPVGLTILAGKPKLGKSWMSLQIAQAVAAGGVALGKHVERGPVLYLALEDSPRRLKDRMRQQNWPTGLRVDFVVVGQFADQIGDLKNGGSRRLTRLLEEKEYRLIVIDTLSRAVYGDQNDADRMTRALSPIHEMAHLHNCAVVMIDHHTKGFGTTPDAVGNILGSTAKGGVSDSIWGLYRERGKACAQLFVTGRDVEEQELALTMDWTTGCWQVEGRANEFDLTERRQEILDVLAEMGPSPLIEIVEAIGQEKGNTYKRLQDLSAAGYVQRDLDSGEKLYKIVEGRL